MPRRKRTARRIASLTDLTSGEYWELLTGPRSCVGHSCGRAGHTLVQRLGTPINEPERPISTVTTPDGAQRPAPYALCSEWATAEDRRIAYYAVRDALLATSNGDRPWAWWTIEQGVVPPSDEAAWLAERHMLSAAEEGHIVSWADRAAAMAWERGITASNGYSRAATIIRSGSEARERRARPGYPL